MSLEGLGGLNVHLIEKKPQGEAPKVAVKPLEGMITDKGAKEIDKVVFHKDGVSKTINLPQKVSVNDLKNLTNDINKMIQSDRNGSIELDDIKMMNGRFVLKDEL